MSSPSRSRGLGIHQLFEQMNGSPQYLGTIQSTGTNVISNLSSAIKQGDRLLVQPDAAGYCLGSNHATTPTVTNSSTTGVYVEANEKFFIGLVPDESSQNTNGEKWLQWISVTGTTNLKVWLLK